MMRFFSCLIAISVIGAAVSDGVSASSKSPRILYLGDSLSIGAFGKTLDHSMRSSGFQVHTVVAGGASPYYWLKNYQALPCTIGFWEKSPSAERRVGYVRAVPKLEDLIAEHKPNVVVVQTGINLYATLRSKRRTKDENVEEVRSLIEQMCYAIAKAGATSYWVLPPHSHEKRYSKELQGELTAIMQSVVRKYEGEVFESQKVTKFVDPYPATDGIHYGPSEARGWAEKVSQHFSQFMKVSPPTDTRTIVRAVPIQAPKVTSSSRLLASSNRAPSASQSSELELELKLVEKSELKNLSELDYSNALGVYEYEVMNVRRGSYPFDRIRIAHGIVFQKKYTSAAKREIGTEMALTVVPLSEYKTLSTWQMVDDLRMNGELSIYTPKLD
ncbi:MAG: hypothetical protein MI807_19775 [Verrucomicrobiales bacterium]|nr:hypothetical protein [Verrucomicrobiales bacterium]